MMAKLRSRAFKTAGLVIVSVLAACSIFGGCGSVEKQGDSARKEAAAPADQGLVEVNGVALSRQKVPDGGLLVVRVKSPVTPVAEFEGITFPFYSVPEHGADAYEALMAVPFDHKPAKAVLKIRAGDSIKEVPFEIIDGGYPSEKLTVNGRHVNPKKKDLERIQREREEVGKIYAQISQERLWKGRFALPIASAMTSRFGTKRVFNGQMQSFHQGLDLRAAIGTPIHAPAGGRIVLAKDLFFTGNTLLVDHGYGLVTIYAHMSRMDVKVGDVVKAGQAMGLSGMTGRASGPHLHWGAVLGKLKVNPLDLVEGIDPGMTSGNVGKALK